MEEQPFEQIKKMKWLKLKNIFCPDGQQEWLQSHASYPWTEYIGGSIFKIYFSSRNAQQQSCIAYVLLDIDTLNIIELSPSPILIKGEIGTFDDSGVSMSCIANVNGHKYLYYLGWNILLTVPWKNTIGLAIESEANHFEKYSKAPIMGIHKEDPFTLTYPFVMKDEGIYKMWYGSSLFWGPKVENTLHVIRYATSKDGIEWERHGVNCIIPKYEQEFAIVKPFVLKENDLYKMWYSFRQGALYKIGYAESPDGIEWVRKDEEVGIDVSDSGWDSEMVCYPYIFDFQGQRYMLYNGNGYGKTGFGLAVLENKE
jgi:hypothetical protein